MIRNDYERLWFIGCPLMVDFERRHLIPNDGFTADRRRSRGNKINGAMKEKFNRIRSV